MNRSIVLTSFCIVLVTAACSGASTDSSGSASENLGQGMSHRAPDAGDGRGHDANERDAAGGRGTGGGQGVGAGQDDGADCKPLDGGPSPCAREDDKDGGHPRDDASDKDLDDAERACKPLDGGPSPCAHGEGPEHHPPHGEKDAHAD
jgi:hypothetical protein